ncbi:hypothetical protein M0R45_001343 [Rubus argutus]|uniref:Uncharacterized protein n=1 Tax=Rubus argutus TaxID=59490 RepID=A0AAW1VHV0_RUBAR
MAGLVRWSRVQMRAEQGSNLAEIDEGRERRRRRLWTGHGVGDAMPTEKRRGSSVGSMVADRDWRAGGYGDAAAS